MSIENPLWGAPRIHGELLKLGFEVAQSRVAKTARTKQSSASIYALTLGGSFSRSNVDEVFGIHKGCSERFSQWNLRLTLRTGACGFVHPVPSLSQWLRVHGRRLA